MLEQIFNLSRRTIVGHIRSGAATRARTFPRSFSGFLDDRRFFEPTAKVLWNFAHEHLSKRFEPVQKSAVATIEFVERPREDTNAIGQRMLDLLQRDLWLGAEHDVIGYVVFFRRSVSLAQDSGR